MAPKRITRRLTTTEIHNILSKNEVTKPLYRGTFPHDLLPRYGLTTQQKPAIIVVNHGSSLTPGTHWSLVYFPKSSLLPAYYFDSFGKNVYPLWNLEAFIKRNSKTTGYTFNARKLQNERSSSCGQFVVVTAWLLARGVSPDRVQGYFTSPHNECFLRQII